MVGANVRGRQAASSRRAFEMNLRWAVRLVKPAREMHEISYWLSPLLLSPTDIANRQAKRQAAPSSAAYLPGGVVAEREREARDIQYIRCGPLGVPESMSVCYVHAHQSSPCTFAFSSVLCRAVIGCGFCCSSHMWDTHHTRSATPAPSTPARPQPFAAARRELVAGKSDELHALLGSGSPGQVEQALEEAAEALQGELGLHDEQAGRIFCSDGWQGCRPGVGGVGQACRAVGAIPVGGWCHACVFVGGGRGRGKALVARPLQTAPCVLTGTWPSVVIKHCSNTAMLTPRHTQPHHPIHSTSTPLGSVCVGGGGEARARRGRQGGSAGQRRAQRAFHGPAGGGPRHPRPAAQGAAAAVVRAASRGGGVRRGGDSG